MLINRKMRMQGIIDIKITTIKSQDSSSFPFIFGINLHLSISDNYLIAFDGDALGNIS